MVVYVIEDLDYFMECARGARIKLWKQKKVGNEVEVRLKAGTVGFKKVFDVNDPELKKLREIIEVEGFVELIDVEADDSFFLF